MESGGGGQTAKEPSSWTVDMLKEHVISIVSMLKEYVVTTISLNDKRYEERFVGQVQAVKDALAAQEKAVNAALVAAEKAVNVAETNAQEWRKGANEWRQAMTDREIKFVSTSEFSLIKERLDRSDGKGAGLHAGWGYLIGGIGLVAAVIAMFAGFRP